MGASKGQQSLCGGEQLRSGDLVVVMCVRVRVCTHTQLSGQNLNVSVQLRSVIGRTPRMSFKMFQTLSDAPPPVCFQFDSVADISDVSSNVTLKSYTMHFEVARVRRERVAFLHGVRAAR